MPINVAVLNTDKSIIPVWPGVYVFTRLAKPIAPNEVLYVGEAKSGLRGRLVKYLIDLNRCRNFPPKKGSKYHRGAVDLFWERKKKGDHGVYVRWAEYGAGPDHILDLEASLIDYLQPHFNHRDESAYRPILEYRDGLIPGAYLT